MKLFYVAFVLFILFALTPLIAGVILPFSFRRRIGTRGILDALRSDGGLAPIITALEECGFSTTLGVSRIAPFFVRRWKAALVLENVPIFALVGNWAFRNRSYLITAFTNGAVVITYRESAIRPMESDTYLRQIAGDIPMQQVVELHTSGVKKFLAKGWKPVRDTSSDGLLGALASCEKQTKWEMWSAVALGLLFLAMALLAVFETDRDVRRQWFGVGACLIALQKFISLIRARKTRARGCSGNAEFER